MLPKPNISAWSMAALTVAKKDITVQTLERSCIKVPNGSNFNLQRNKRKGARFVPTVGFNVAVI